MRLSCKCSSFLCVCAWSPAFIHSPSRLLGTALICTELALNLHRTCTDNALVLHRRICGHLPASQGERCSSGERRVSRESSGVPRVPSALRTDQGTPVLRASTTGQEPIQRAGLAQRVQLSGARARARRAERRRTPCQKGPSCGHSVSRRRRKRPRASRHRGRAGPQRGTFWKS